MKRLGLVVMVAALAACEGPVGPEGPAGAQGPQGEQGPAGSDADATAVRASVDSLAAEIDSLRAQVQAVGDYADDAWGRAWDAQVDAQRVDARVDSIAEAHLRGGGNVEGLSDSLYETGTLSYSNGVLVAIKFKFVDASFNDFREEWEVQCSMTFSFSNPTTSTYDMTFVDLAFLDSDGLPISTVSSGLGDTFRLDEGGSAVVQRIVTTRMSSLSLTERVAGVNPTISWVARI